MSGLGEAVGRAMLSKEEQRRRKIKINKVKGKIEEALAKGKQPSTKVLEKALKVHPILLVSFDPDELHVPKEMLMRLVEKLPSAVKYVQFQRECDEEVLSLAVARDPSKLLDVNYNRRKGSVERVAKLSEAFRREKGVNRKAGSITIVGIPADLPQHLQEVLERAEVV